MKIDRSTVLRRAASQLSCLVNGEAVVLHVPDAMYYSMDDVGAFVWQQIEQPLSVAELSARVAACYDVDDRQCEADVIEFLTSVHAAGLLEIMGKAQQERNIDACPS